jgi:hypothetical protein
MNDLEKVTLNMKLSHEGGLEALWGYGSSCLY